jgi:hypothetical protein
MQKIINAIILSCLKATGLLEKRRHCRLENVERIQLKMHLSMCRNCSNYAKQSGFIDRLLNRKLSSLPSSAETSLLEERIITDLDNKF